MRLRLRPVARALFPIAQSRPRPKARSRVQRAKRSLVVGLTLVVLAQIAMGLAVETIKPEWRDPEYGHRFKQLQRLRQTHPERPIVVAVGSSRTLMGLSPIDMGFPDEPGSPLVYNFGQTGAGPLQMLLTIERLLDSGVKPAFLLVELFPAALVADGSAEEMLSTWGPRFGQGDVNRIAPYAHDHANIRQMWLTNRIASWYSLRLTLMNHWQPNWLPMTNRIDFQWDRLDPRGWLPYPRDSLPDAIREHNIALTRESYAKRFTDYRIGATSDRVIRDLLARCQREEIPAAFYLTPEGPAFRSLYSAEASATFAEYVRLIQHEYGIPVIDTTSGFEEIDFADSHHLLPGGAARFSHRLADHFIRDWVRNHQSHTNSP